MHTPAEKTRIRKQDAESHTCKGSGQGDGHEGGHEDGHEDEHEEEQHRSGTQEERHKDEQHHSEERDTGLEDLDRDRDEEEDDGRSRSSMASARPMEMGRRASSVLPDHSSLNSPRFSSRPSSPSSSAEGSQSRSSQSRDGPGPGPQSNPDHDFDIPHLDDDFDTIFDHDNTPLAHQRHSPTRAHSADDRSAGDHCDINTTRPSSRLGLEMALVSKRLAKDGGGGVESSSTEMKAWNRDDGLAVARDVFRTLCRTDDQLMTPDMMPDPAGSLLERSIAVKHNIHGTTLFTLLSSVQSPIASAERLWFVAEVDLTAPPKAFTYTSAPPEARPSMSGLIKQLHSDLQQAQIFQGDLLMVTDADSSEHADFISCLAVATTLLAGCKPVWPITTDLWTSFFQACQVPYHDRRTSHLQNNLALFNDNESARASKRPKLEPAPNPTASAEQKMLHQALCAYQQKFDRFSKRKTLIDSYASQAKHIRLCINTVSERTTVSHEVKLLRDDIAAARRRMEKAEPGSASHVSASGYLRSLQADLEEMQAAGNLPHVRTWADKVVAGCDAEIDTIERDRESALAEIRNAFSDAERWMSEV
ncbi:hypothetical protein TI39_contig1085g00006 [Zymoseptoria brevis]|uniref:Uncharacterized protein n=1 Tax=Zymoseptoria brevis TaxID=1047168 RepID=A0A0F4GE79_9PEZI|nr:hypothetical protein TI39_contig1085g00006 [Zymoseptoria brevis]